MSHAPRSLLALSLLLTLVSFGCDPSELAVPDDSISPTERAELFDGVLELPQTPYSYRVIVPAHLQADAERLDNTPRDNPITDAGATLGRVLFWDNELSANRTLACASCHVDVAGFADSVALSEGFDGGLTGRKSMPLVNVAYYGPGRMFWDERAATLEDQVLLPIQDDVEMGLTVDELVQRVEDAPYYAPLFLDAFGDTEVTEDRIADALAQLVRSMVSFDSAWDAGVVITGDPLAPFPNFTPQQNRGKAIFFGRHEPGAGPLCAGCHLPPSAGRQPGAPPPPPSAGIFYMPGPRVNGLDDPEDLGIFESTGRPGDRHRFKSPTLRNVELRAPYFHDGRFETLEEVVRFYNEEIELVPNLDPILTDGNQPRRLNLSQADQDALVAFLKTLTDPGPVLDERFADPFLR